MVVGERSCYIPRVVLACLFEMDMWMRDMVSSRYEVFVVHYVVCFCNIDAMGLVAFGILSDRQYRNA
ncbi:uncharacterized protein CC84DRAFT_878897 [Paraphaeosphaeria sporulosa]|uniref:Uncharacterized protein n=1 Tax=Paraphaeosphaeria sporulosa TaxID=1460663 RepID=A0A177CAW6_9PLEO|nr:uncharacterized protein CC84DRAFT_878897 [Paraphaeosphaeria sporulosa]OAG03992.1 hypothetical protein CC84DRAFT_878897 [Paraphaeosphaeria sporulosa]